MGKGEILCQTGRWWYIAIKSFTYTILFYFIKALKLFCVFKCLIHLVYDSVINVVSSLIESILQNVEGLKISMFGIIKI